MALSQSELETGTVLAPSYNADGLVAAVAVDHASGDVLMMAWMNEAALQKTMQTGEAWYWSRSRNALWHKGATSGQIQTVQDIYIDCDQDAVLLRVTPGGNGGCCHVGYRSCFFRKVTEAGTLEKVGAPLA